MAVCGGDLIPAMLALSDALLEGCARECTIAGKELIERVRRQLNEGPECRDRRAGVPVYFACKPKT
jgi:hypothetical protein